MKGKWAHLFILVLLARSNSGFGYDRFPVLPTPQSSQYLNENIVLSPDHPEVNYIVPLRAESTGT